MELKDVCSDGRGVVLTGGRFIILPRHIGGGSFGNIFECYDRSTKRILAVKVEDSSSAPRLQLELKVYRKLHDPQLSTTELNRVGACLKALDDYVSASDGSDKKNQTSSYDNDNKSRDDHDSDDDHSGSNSGSNNNSNHHESNRCSDDKHKDHEASSVSRDDAGGQPPSREEININQCIDDALKEAIPNMHKHTVIGFPFIYYYGNKGNKTVIVMDMCGPSLEELFNYCHRCFSLKTVVMLADQILQRIQFFHDKGFVHRDIKPENFVTGKGLQGHIIYLIDFGLSKMYWNSKWDAHIPFRDGKSLTGTVRYCSIKAHKGFEQSRRDDLEAIGFMLVYFLKGSLPWQGLNHEDKDRRMVAIGSIKEQMQPKKLCYGLPDEFEVYISYCRSLPFSERPDYKFLRKLFRYLGYRAGYVVRPRSEASLVGNCSRVDLKNDSLVSQRCSTCGGDKSNGGDGGGGGSNHTLCAPNDSAPPSSDRRYSYGASTDTKELPTTHACRAEDENYNPLSGAKSLLFSRAPGNGVEAIPPSATTTTKGLSSAISDYSVLPVEQDGSCKKVLTTATREEGVGVRKDGRMSRRIRPTQARAGSLARARRASTMVRMIPSRPISRMALLSTPLHRCRARIDVSAARLQTRLPPAPRRVQQISQTHASTTGSLTGLLNEKRSCRPCRSK